MWRSETHVTAALSHVLLLPPGGTLFCVEQGIEPFSCGPSLKLPQVVVEGLDVGEHTHGVWFPAHDHHIFHFDQTVTARLRPEEHTTIYWIIGILIVLVLVIYYV